MNYTDLVLTETQLTFLADILVAVEQKKPIKVYVHPENLKKLRNIIERAILRAQDGN